MIEITTPADPDAWKDKREPIFSIDGMEYTMPVEVPGSVALEAMEMFRTLGDAAATPWLLDLMLGVDGHRALRESGASKGQVGQVATVIRDKVFGDLEGDQGK
jgi:hypothetical protein